jgi:carbon monoxide dehydrogenase subunit G
MKLEGTFSINAPRTAVWMAIRDPALMARCIPGCETAERIDDTRYRAVVGVKFGPISARFNIVVEIEEEIAPRMVRSHARGEEGTRASVLSAVSILTLEETEAGRTDVAWSSDVMLTGRLGKYGLGLMRKKAESLSADFVTAFSASVQAGGEVP